MRMAMTVTAALAALFGLGGGAAAAPQVLALASTEGPVALTCRGDACAARLTSFCLQPERAAPTAGHRYELAGGTLQVTGRTAAGETVRLDPGLVAITAERTHLAVRLSLSRDELARRGLQEVAVEVGPDATLVPAPVAGDDQPIAAGELATIATGMRAVGSRVVDRDPVRMVAARAMSRLINGLPEGRLTPAAAQAATARLLPAKAVAALPAAARALVTDARDDCLLVSGKDMAGTFRQCLESEHDSMMSYLNMQFWKVARTGS